jgi:hypothetical protein
VTLSSGETVRFGSNEAFATVNGTNPAVPRVFARPVARGSTCATATSTPADGWRSWAPGWSTSLFEGADPLGRTISLGGVRFRVIGVFEEVGSSGFGADQDSEVHIPVTAAQRLFGDLRVDAFALKAPTTEQLDEVSAQALAVLADRYPDEEFSAVTQDQILGAVGRILGLLTSVLAAIAAISLLVGGVGVSNIMLVSVRERTRRSACARRSAPAAGHHAAVPARGGAAHDDRRRDRDPAGRGRGARAQRGRRAAAGRGHLVVPGDGVRGQCGRRHLLRGRAGPPGGKAGPRRGAAYRVSGRRGWGQGTSKEPDVGGGQP